jgi:hypothetical protein
MSDAVRWVLGILITLAGLAAIFLSWRLEGEEEWPSSALLEIGAVLLLLVPLLLFERLFERRVERVERETAEQVAGVREEVATARAEVAAALGEVQESTEARLAERRASDQATVNRARDYLSLENVTRLLELAQRLGAVSSGGVRVPIPNASSRIKFEKVHMAHGASGDVWEEFWVSIVDAEGERGPRVTWQPEELGPDVMVNLIEVWQRAGTYPGEGFLNAKVIFEGLIETLDMVIERRRAGGERSLGPMLERTSEHWALTDRGMEHLGALPYIIDAEKIRDDPEPTRDHMLEKPWVRDREAEFRESFEVARTYFQGREAARLAALPHWMR